MIDRIPFVTGLLLTLLALPWGQMEGAVTEFSRKKIELEEVFMEIVKGGRDVG